MGEEKIDCTCKITWETWGFGIHMKDHCDNCLRAMAKKAYKAVNAVKKVNIRRLLRSK